MLAFHIFAPISLAKQVAWPYLTLDEARKSSLPCTHKENWQICEEHDYLLYSLTMINLNFGSFR